MRNLVHQLVGGSPTLDRVIDFIGRASASRANVLIQGESGTGKELVAGAIHHNSARAGGPYVQVNAAALPDDLLENELFGHEKEAYSGALSRQQGKFEAAQGGTLFLDEIGEISRGFQAKLLRAVEYRQIQRLGGSSIINTDVRLIAATNCDLQAMAEAGSFRPDLYYRLDVLSVVLPPLRERRQDIPLLARHFVSSIASEEECAEVDISPAAMLILSSHHWPGNVRELKHVIERTMALWPGEDIQVSHLPHLGHAADQAPAPTARPAYRETLEEATFRMQRDYVADAIRLQNGNMKKAAEILGVHPNSFHRMLDRLELSHLKRASVAQENTLQVTTPE